MAATFVVCETLYYIRNNSAGSTKAGMLTAVSGFYTTEEIVEVRNKLYELAGKLCDEGVPPAECKHRKKTRKQGEQKRHLDMEDLQAMYGELDTLKAPLPVFAAADLQRIPPFLPDATDFCSLALSVSQLQSRLAMLEQHVNGQLPQGNCSPPVITDHASSVVAGECTNIPEMTEDDSESWATKAAIVDGPWQLVTYKKPSRPTAVSEPFLNGNCTCTST